METILVTGGAGFIAGCYVRQLVREGKTRVVNLDKLTYAGNLDSLADIANRDEHVFVQGVRDRPGHDRRYAIDCTKIKRELGWEPHECFESGIERTVQWYIDHPDWVRRVTSGKYQLQRLGVRKQEPDGHP